MKKISFVLVVVGILFIVFSVLGDIIGLGKREEVGAAQILGIDIGVFLVLIAIGSLFLEWRGEIKFGMRLRHLLNQISDLPPAVWVISTFIAVYILFFVFPLFFTKPSIQYFTKYIPDAWVTHIGFDMDMTMGRVGRWLTTNQSPYLDNYYYSPLTLVLFAPLLILGYPVYYKLITIVSIISFIVCALFIPIIVSPRKNYALLILFFITGLFSYGFQFELERGQYNIIAFSLALFAIYLFHRNDQYRYFAYLLFSLSIQLKIYPVFLVVMFVKDWGDWKNNIRRVIGLGILNFGLLFVLGYQMFIDFVNNLSGVQLNFQSSRLEDLSIKGFVYNLTTDGFGIIPSDLLAQLAHFTGLIEGIILIIFCLCLFSVIVYDYAHKHLGLNPYLMVICTIGMLIIPSASVDYKLPLLIAPLAVVFSELQIVHRRYITAAYISLIMIASTSYWLTLYPFIVKPYLISRNFPALFILLISTTLLYILREHPHSQVVHRNN